MARAKYYIKSQIEGEEIEELGKLYTQGQGRAILNGLV